MLLRVDRTGSRVVGRDASRSPPRDAARAEGSCVRSRSLLRYPRLLSSPSKSKLFPQVRRPLPPRSGVHLVEVEVVPPSAPRSLLPPLRSGPLWTKSGCIPAESRRPTAMSRQAPNHLHDTVGKIPAESRRLTAMSGQEPLVPRPLSSGAFPGPSWTRSRCVPPSPIDGGESLNVWRDLSPTILYSKKFQTSLS